MIRAFSYRTCLAAVTLLSAIPAAAQTPQTIDGNLTVTGWGKFNDGIDLGANADASFNWLAPQTTAFDIVAPSGVFLWRDTITSTPSAKNKMQLDGGNNLTLHKPNGDPGIVLDPSAGKITLPAGTGSGIYFGTNDNATLKATAAGNPIFSSKVLFENGADFGTGNTLNASNVQFLRGTLANLGYRETPINATPISSIKTTGDITISRIVNADGLQYVLGNFSGQANIGTGWLAEYGPGSAGFLAKCDASGAVLWVRQFESPAGHFNLSNVAINSSGNIAVAGDFNGTTNSFGTGNELTSTSNDGFVAVYNSSGAVQWTKAIGGAGWGDSMRSVAIAANGAVTVGGVLSETTTTTLAPLVLTSAGSNDGVVVRFTSSGTISWAKAIGGTGWDDLSAVTEDSAGNVIVTGSFEGALTTLGLANRPAAGGSDGFLVKLNGLNGEALWSKAVGGVSWDYLIGHVLDSTGNIITYGQFNQTTTNLEVGKNRSSAGGADGIVVKTDTFGVTQWTQAIGGLGYDQPSGVVLAADGKIVIAGMFNGSTTTLGTGLNVSSSADTQDILLVEIDPLAGSVTQALALGGTSYEYISSLSLSGASGLCIVGSTGESFALGNARMHPYSFNASWQGFNVVTPATSAATSFSWSGGLAAGTGSIAVGNQAYASGSGSTALGSSSATGDSSFAAGKGMAFGAESVAIGTGSKAKGQGSFALGRFNNTNGSSSFAIGQSNNVDSDSGFAFGIYNSLSGNAWGSVSIGVSNGWHGDSGELSVALGCGSTAIGNYSTAIGMAVVSYSYMNTALGSGNLGGGNATSWIETDPLLELGNQEWGDWNAPENRSNAITTLKNGQTTLSNKAWKANVKLNPAQILIDPPATTDSAGEALVVEGHTRLKGMVVIEQAQGDISMGIYQ